MTASWRALLDFAVEAAWEAGRITLRYFQMPIPEERKADQSPVTIADREAEAHLRRRIAERYPDHGIVGEEYGLTRPEAPFQWVLDPIDGTRSFLCGVPLYGVLVGLLHEGQPVLGVACFPALQEIVYAALGEGCRWNGRLVRVSRRDRLEEAVLLYTDPRGFEGPKKALLERLRPRVRLERSWGDCYGHILVATGRADVMLDPAMHLWDSVALYPILHEAGGTFTDWEGRATIQAGEAVSTNGLLLSALLEEYRFASP
ncbi:MAG: inositol monophosphatase family protein [Bacteroidota bacterium]|nr:inositol monophosphatase family protein [Bacteroidota bacterium]MDW8137579.1 inositol monophosphatase family protein [Bacteroidota bacterium]